MPITKSAKKALKQSIKRRKRNLLRKNKIKETLKAINKFVEAKNYEEAKKLLPQFYKAVDKAAKSGILKKNTASRKKSKIARLVNKIKK